MKKALEDIDIFKLLEKNKIDRTFTDVADLLWLYFSIGGESQSSEDVNNKETKEEKEKSQRQDTSDNNKEQEESTKDTEANNRSSLHTNDDKKDGKSKGNYFKTPTRKQFNQFNQFATVFKILKQFSNSSSEQEFNENETIEYIANTNVWNIQTTPKKELKYTLFIVVEKSTSMRIWEEITQEFVSALSRFSFFKDVKVVYLKELDEKYQLYRDKQCNKEVSTKLFNSQTQRTLTILLSDCISRGWQDKRGYGFLDEVTAVTPFLIVNMLPQRVWNRTIVNDSWRVKFTHRDGWKNSSLVSDEEEDIKEELGSEDDSKENFIRVPMTTLEKIPLKHWANVIAGYKNNWLHGSLFEAEVFDLDIPPKDEIKQTSSNSISPKQQVKNFYAYASPLAHELAIYFSVISPLSLEIMKMIQKTSLPKTNYTHLAEVFLSGLLKKGESKTRANDDIYLFKDGIKEVLSKRLPPQLKEKIQESNSEFIKEHLGHLQEFQSVVESDEGSVDGVSSKSSDGFASLEITKKINSLTIEELKEIIAQDENEKLEFKARWNYSIQELVKYIFSLVNGSPKHIDETAYFIIGVDERDKNNFKLTKKLANFDKFKKELFENLNDYAQPKLKDMLIEWYNLAKNNGVIVISIPPQGHIVSLDKDLRTIRGIDKRGTVYYRIGESIRVASADIIKDFEKAYNRPSIQLTSKLGKSSIIGRKQELKDIDKILNKSDILVLNGMGGVGKSTLASYYLHSKKDKYDYYGFFEGLESFTSELRIRLDLKSEKPDELFSEALSKLEKLDGNKLLVLDDVKDVEENQEDINKILALRDSGYKILITSRQKINFLQEYSLNNLLLHDARNLFLNYYQTEQLSKIDAIIGYLDYHALFVELIAKIIDNEGYTLDEIIKKFEKGELSKIEFISENNGEEVSFNKNLQELFHMQQKNLKDEDLLLLKQLTIFPSIDIEYSFLKSVLGKERLKGRLNFLVQKGWLSKSEESYKLHQIMKEYLLANHTPIFENIKLIFETYFKLIENSSDILVALKNRKNLIYFDSILKFLDGKNEKIATFLNNLGGIYFHLGIYNKSEKLYIKSLKIKLEILGEENLSTANSYNNLANLYNIMEKYDKAEQLYLKALKIREKLLGEEHPDTAISYNNLANLYQSIKEYQKAKPLYLKTLKINENILGEEHPNTATAYNNLAGLYQSIEEYKKAEPLYLKALKIREKVLGKSHSSTATTYNNLGVLYYSQENFEKAYTYMEKSVNLWSEILPEEHPNLVNLKEGLAEVEAKILIKEERNSRKLKVLFVSANPSKDLNLDEEIRNVQKAINEHTQKRDSIEFIHRSSVKMNDLMLLLRKEKPHILHFIGHGVNGELCMIDDKTREEIPIPIEELSLLFKNIKRNGNLKLVFLNSCYSKEQAKAIIKHTDYVIEMKNEINDDTARTLSKQFYASFATGASVEDAFTDAKVMVITNHYGEEEIIELVKRDEGVEDFSIVDIVGDEEQKATRGDTNNITINGSVNGVAHVSGGTVNHTINTKSYIENIDNQDGGTINFN